MTTAVPTPPFHHVALAGISFCGSTLLSVMLGGLEGVGNIGESHKLTLNADLLDTELVGDATQEINGRFVRDCKTCGPDCSVFPNAFRLALYRDPSNWYQKIHAQLGCKTLLSSDKNHAKLIAHDPSLNMSAIVLFKPPIESCYSFYRKVQSAEYANHTSFDLAYFKRAWLKSYQSFLDSFDVQGVRTVLNFEAFRQSPEHHMRRLCQLIDIPFDENCLQTATPSQHYFGGNRRVNKPYVSGTYAIDIQPPEPVELPESILRDLQDDEALQSLYARLQQHYLADFGH